MMKKTNSTNKLKIMQTSLKILLNLSFLIILMVRKIIPENFNSPTSI